MTSLRRLWLVWLLCWSALAGVLCGASASVHAQDLQPVPALSARVVDTVALLAPASRDGLESKLAALEQEKGAQVVFLIVGTTAPEDIASYANRIGNAWKVGRAGVGDGLLLVVARDDRKVRIEVAKTLEGAIPDLAAKTIIDEAITPAFRRGDYAAGLDAAADRIGALVRGEALPPVTTRGNRPEVAGMQLEDFAIFLFVVVPVVAAVLRARFGRKTGALMAGAGTGVLAWLITASVLATAAAAVIGLIVAFLGSNPLRSGLGRSGRHHHGGWGAGAGSWGSGGGGFSSGGGGDFGGGGASGDW